MRLKIFGKELSLLEGPTDNVVTRAKAYSTVTGLDLMQDPNRNFQRMRGLRNIYLQGAYVSEGVDLYPLYALGNGYDLEIDEEVTGDGEKAKKDVEEFLTKINFFDVMWQLMVDAEVVRDGIAEIVYGRGSLGQVPVNIVVRPAECFEFDTDLKGAILSYTQMYDNRGNSIQKIALPPDQVLHYQYMSRSDSPYGISVIERVLHDIKRDTRVIEATANGIVLHGTPKWHIQANSRKIDAIPLTDTEFSALETQFKDFNAKDQFVTEGDLLIEPKDTAGVPNVQQYSDVTLTRVVSGMGIPGELLGLRQGTTDATAVTRVGAFFKKIKSCQRDIEQLWNAQIIDKITGTPGLIKLVLTDTDPSDFAKMAAAMASLRTGMDPDAVCPADWCREQLGIPPDEDVNLGEQAPESNQQFPDQSGQIPGQPGQPSPTGAAPEHVVNYQVGMKPFMNGKQKPTDAGAVPVGK